MSTKSTREVAIELGTTPVKLLLKIRNSILPEPKNKASGQYRWTERDIETAKKVLKIM